MAAISAPLTPAMFEPDIAQNAGAMLRTCACLGARAAIIEPAGFPVSERIPRMRWAQGASSNVSRK
jgi:tRNA(Leu) C34 or U34 (ribose-2'-O)-methylase TrmL